MFAANVVAVRLHNRADRHLRHLRATAHDDDPLPVDPLHALHHIHAPHNRQRAQIAQHHFERRRLRRPNLEIDPGALRRVFDDGAGADVALVIRNHTRQAVEHPRPGDGVNQKSMVVCNGNSG